MSQSDGVVKTVGPDTYRFYYLDPLVAADMSWDIANVLSPAMGALGGKMLTEKGNSVAKFLDGVDGAEAAGYESAVERAVVGFFKHCTKDMQRDVIEKLSKVCHIVKGQNSIPMEGQFTLHFRGRPLAMYRWALAGLSVQFKDFFSELGPVIGRVVRQAGESNLPNTSEETPLSGA